MVPLAAVAAGLEVATKAVDLVKKVAETAKTVKGDDKKAEKKEQQQDSVFYDSVATNKKSVKKGFQA